MVEIPIKMYIQNLAKAAHEAARPLALVSTQTRTSVLEEIASQLESQREQIVEANDGDLQAIPKDIEPDAYRQALERIRVTEEDISRIAGHVREIAAEPDPTGEISEGWLTVDGLQLSKVRVPIGVIAIISDFGPDVVAESLAMCLRSGNVGIIRGGKDWFLTNTAVARIFKDRVESAEIPIAAATFLERPDRDGILELTKLPKHINGVIPRGGAGLRRAVIEQSRVPVLGYDGGPCHVYIDGDADLPLSQSVVVNSKIQDPSASNAADTLLVHQAMGRQLLPGLLRRLLEEFQVNVIGCPKTVALMGMMEMTGHKGIKTATEEDWGAKFQSLTLAIKIVKDFDEGLDHIARYGPGHTDVIVTRDYATAMRFVREVDSSAVFVNASTRLNSGDQMGMGREIGQNSSHFHLRGPLTLKALTTEKYVGLGTGQLRHPHPVPQAYQDAMMLSAKF